MNSAQQHMAMARVYREKAAYIRKEGIERWPGAFEQLWIWHSEERMFLAHAEAHEAAAEVSL